MSAETELCTADITNHFKSFRKFSSSHCTKGAHSIAVSPNQKVTSRAMLRSLRSNSVHQREALGQVEILQPSKDIPDVIESLTVSSMGAISRNVDGSHR
ncbi:hypothetical protein EWB00_008700 [Schistosoma japonicum]|uniref:Uncharacterized protein n=1 Tax=Schistosoma japonicum TaxID=6182 RepID=A0A4Z2CNX7_SCHJA|nr:hypothetical protein EWB00_008700 [Schistosoma japonicum]